MSAILVGRTDWRLVRDENGYRDYSLEWLITTTALNDGPFTVLNCPGLPSVGYPWQFGTDSDGWAFCRPDAEVFPVVSHEPGYWWIIKQTYSNRPLQRCQETNIENPLDEPDRISGGFSTYTDEAGKDANGNTLENSAFEQITGALVERDANRPVITIEKTALDLDLGLIASFIDCVNDDELWGLPAKTIKLSNAPWSRRLYGVCTYYFVVRYEFEINFDTWVREAPNKSTKVLKPGVVFANAKPDDFIPYIDEDTGRAATIYLNKNTGQIWKAADGEAARVLQFDLYESKNFFELGLSPVLY